MGLFMLAAGMYALETIADAISDANININVGGDNSSKKEKLYKYKSENIKYEYEDEKTYEGLYKKDDYSGVYGRADKKIQITYKCPGCGASIVGLIGTKVKCEYCDTEHIIEEQSERVQKTTESKNISQPQKNNDINEKKGVNNSSGIAPAMIFGMGGVQGNQTPAQSETNPLDILNQQIEQVKGLNELLEIGAITQEEFETKKRQIMNL